MPWPHVLKHHPVVTAVATGVGLAVVHNAKWRKSTAHVRRLETTHEGVIVEMDDDYVFVADLEQLQSLAGAKESGAQVRYWINNHKMILGKPRGGLGDGSALGGLL